MEEVDRWFSRWVRIKDADENNMVKCCTCGMTAYYASTLIQCGHYRKRRFMSTRFVLPNAAPQCFECNQYEDGAEYKHANYIDNKYGEGTAEELRILSHNTTKFAKWELKEMASDFKAKVKQELKKRGLRTWG